MSMTFTQAIAALGETQESVSAKLREMGIKGYRRMCSSCPIAEYLHACGFPFVTVSSVASFYVEGNSCSDESIPLNKGVKQWMACFDDGGHSEFFRD